ncbi:porin family protein [Bernardetia sp. Wsw4-3y2]|uniref:porin family protein n=1 Tax=unclassified Bernardetia TaxID=2647129 RepID=UPI0030CD7C47
MKKTFFLSLLFCLAITYQLQAQNFSYSGFKTGLSVGRAPISFEKVKIPEVMDIIDIDTIPIVPVLNLLEVENEKSNGKFNVGLQFGVFAGKEFTKTIGMRMELNYVQMGRVDTINYNQRQKYSLSYFSFDPMLQLRIAPKSRNHFYILAGPSARLLVGNKASGIEGVAPLDVRQTDLGANLGFSYLVGLTPYLYLTLEARAYYGLMNIAQKPKENSVPISKYVNAQNSVLTALFSDPPGEISPETAQTLVDVQEHGLNNNYKISNQGATFSIGFCVPLRPKADKLIKMKKQ